MNDQRSDGPPARIGYIPHHPEREEEGELEERMSRHPEQFSVDASRPGWMTAGLPGQTRSTSKVSTRRYGDDRQPGGRSDCN